MHTTTWLLTVSGLVPLPSPPDNHFTLSMWKALRSQSPFYNEHSARVFHYFPFLTKPHEYSPSPNSTTPVTLLSIYLIKCNFLHIEETCPFYIRNGYCNKVACKTRHPKNCYFFEKGFCKWAEDCRYNHRQSIQTKQCDKCGKDSMITYYCEICENSFCNMCTVEEAHVQDPQISNLTNTCNNIHT